jgi:hypothetical protein
MGDGPPHHPTGRENKSVLLGLNGRLLPLNADLHTPQKEFQTGQGEVGIWQRRQIVEKAPASAGKGGDSGSSQLCAILPLDGAFCGLGSIVFPKSTKDPPAHFEPGKGLFVKTGFFSGIFWRIFGNGSP